MGQRRAALVLVIFLCAMTRLISAIRVSGRLVLARIAIWCCSFTFASAFQLCYLVGKPVEGVSTVGLVSSIAVAGSAVLPAAFGLSADLNGGFTLGFAIFAAVARAGALAGLLAPSS